MTDSNWILLGIFFMLFIIWIYVRWIYLRLEYPDEGDRTPAQPETKG